MAQVWPEDRCENSFSTSIIWARVIGLGAKCLYLMNFSAGPTLSSQFAISFGFFSQTYDNILPVAISGSLSFFAVPCCSVLYKREAQTLLVSNFPPVPPTGYASQ